MALAEIILCIITLMMVLVTFSDVLVSIYQITMCNIPEDILMELFCLIQPAYNVSLGCYIDMDHE
jgi:hypothetical protein